MSQRVNGRHGSGEAIRAARRMVAEFAGRKPESVSGLNRDEDGHWTVCIDVVELARIPPSTDVLATLEVTLDDDLELVDLVRSRRFLRNQVSED